MFLSNKHAGFTRAQFGVEVTGIVGFILNACVLQHFWASIFRNANKIKFSKIFDHFSLATSQKPTISGREDVGKK